MTASLRKRWKFFLKHGGYCTPPGRVDCAMALARAEQWHHDNETAFPELDRDGDEEGEVRVRWEFDPEPMRHDDDDGSKEYYGCIVELWDGEKWEHAASCWGIDVAPPDPFCRVMAAELCAEAMASRSNPVLHPCG